MATAGETESAPGFTVLDERADRVVARLPNRMILVAQSLRTAPVVSVQVWIKTGSLYEQEHVGAGLSHFLEHLISGGSTTNRPESESTATLGRIGAQTNAATSLDTVRYYINTTAAHTTTAIDLLSDWMQNSVITQEEYDRERDVIQSEFSMGQGEPNRIFWKLTQQARFAAQPDHPGAHPTIGYLDEFLTVTRDQIYAFYKRMYVPNNMVMVVTGDIDPRQAVAEMAARWADVPAAELPELSFPAPVAQAAAEPVTVEGVAPVSRQRERLLWPGVKLGAEHDFALDLLATVLGGGESSRLVRELRDEQQRVTSISAFNYSAPWGEGFFAVDCELADPAQSEAVRAAVAAQLDRLRVEPVTDAELARVKRSVLARAVMSGQTASGRASELASDVIAAADPDYHARYAAAVQGLTAADLTAAAVALLDPDDASRVVLRPAGTDYEPVVPARPDATAHASAPRERVTLDNQRLLSLLKLNLAQEGADATPAELDPPQIRTLSNGLTVIAQRNTAVPAVALQFYTLGGLLADPPGREGLSYATWAMLERGTQVRSANALAEAIEDLGAGLSTASGNNTAYVQASALSDDWPTVLGLIAEVLTQPAFDDDEWQRLRPRLVAGIDRATDSWSGELNAIFRGAYFGDHPWSQLPEGRRDAVAAFTAEQLQAHHAATLTASSSALAVVGDVDPEEVFAQAQRLFGDLTTGEPVTAWPAPPTAEPGLRVSQTPKPVAAVKVGYGPGITRDDPDFPAVQVLSRVLGDFPAGWLQQELRGRDGGLVYASGAGAQVGLVPGNFAMIFNAQDTTVTEALRRTVATADRARKEVVSDADLARAKSKVLSSTFQARQSNADLASGMALDLLYGIDDPTGAAFLAAVEAIDAKQLRAVARRRLTGPPVGVLITGSELDEDELKAIVR